MEAVEWDEWIQEMHHVLKMLCQLVYLMFKTWEDYKNTIDSLMHSMPRLFPMPTPINTLPSEQSLSMRPTRI